MSSIKFSSKQQCRFVATSVKSLLKKYIFDFGLYHHFALSLSEDEKLVEHNSVSVPLDVSAKSYGRLV
jgi:hypothetical protein